MSLTPEDYMMAELKCQEAFEKRFNCKLDTPKPTISTNDELIQTHKDIVKLFLDLKPKKPEDDLALFFVCSAKVKQASTRLNNLIKVLK